MGKLSKFSPIARAVGVIGATAGLVTGVTFAALQNTVTLTDNTISAADASLRIWNGTTFASTAPGFTVDDLVPGEGSGPNAFYLQNMSDGDLWVSAHVPNAPAQPEGGYGFTGWKNLEVMFTSDEPGCEDNTVETDMAELLAGNVELPCNPLSEGAQGNSSVPTEGNYTVAFDIDPSSVTPGATDVGVGNFDLQLIGSLIDPSPATEL